MHKFSLICSTANKITPITQYQAVTVGKNEKLETFKLEGLKLESFHLRRKVPIEVGNFLMQS